MKRIFALLLVLLAVIVALRCTTEPPQAVVMTEYIEVPRVVSLGEFKITAYCACEECCGKSPDHPAYGITATGTTATQGRTIAVDPDVIPYGTEVRFIGPDGEMHTYTAEDTGGAIDGNEIDLYFEDHEEARIWGVQTREVFLENGI